MAVHRIIEANAVRYGDSAAISDQRITLSYRELNQRGNIAARHLIAHGLRRGAVATVCLPRSAETAIILLGILKSGATYVLIDGESEESQWPRGVWFEQQQGGNEVCYRNVDIVPTLQQSAPSSANLPIVARESDVACVIPGRDGLRPVLVPHAAIMSLRRSAAPPLAEWSGEAGALELWAGLMNGATVVLSDPGLRSVAA